MPDTNRNNISDGTASSEDLTHYSDAESTFDECEEASSLGLSEQTLLKQAFSVAVHYRRSMARDWRRERESEFIDKLSLAEESRATRVTKKRSYSTKIRSLLQKLTFAGKSA
jgi:hypothetical protein